LRTLRWMVVAAASAAFFVAGCGDDDDEGGTGGAAPAGQSAEGGANPDAAAAQKVLDELAKVPEITKPTEPVKPPEGTKTLGFVTCGNAAAACVTAGEGFKEAAAALGWKTIIVDGKLNPKEWAASVESLVERNVDAIGTIALGDNAIPQALKKAHEAKIPVVTSFGGNDPSAKGPTHADGNVTVDFTLQGKGVGSFMVVHSGGKAQVGQITQSVVNVVKQRQDAVKAAVEACGGCKVVASVEQNPGEGDLKTVSRNAAQGLLQRFPGDKLTYIAPPSDDEGLGAMQAIRASNRKIHTVGYDCTEQGLAEIRKGDVHLGCMTTPLKWASWALVDQIVRLLNGGEALEQNPGTYLVTKETAPASGEEVQQPDYQSHYKKLWGIS